MASLDEPPALVTVWDEMRRARADERPIYFRLDTHWTNAGASVMAEAIVESLADAGWNDDAISKIGTVDHEGDLTIILGLPSSEPSEELEVVLPGSELLKEIRTLMTPTGEEVTSVVAVDFSIEGEAVVPGHTLVMHDSFGWALTPMIAPYFETSSIIAETDPERGYMWTDLDAADTVVHVSVQRELHETILGRDLAAAFVAAYAESYEHTDGGALAAGSSVDVDALEGWDRYVIVQLADGSDTSTVTVGDRTVTLTPDSPRTAFTMVGPATLTASGAAEYSFVSIER